jgi:hypothetical protein
VRLATHQGTIVVQLPAYSLRTFVEISLVHARNYRVFFDLWLWPSGARGYGTKVGVFVGGRRARGLLTVNSLATPEGVEPPTLSSED